MGSVALSSLMHGPCWWREVTCNAQSRLSAAPFAHCTLPAPSFCLQQLSIASCCPMDGHWLNGSVAIAGYAYGLSSSPPSGVAALQPNACHWIVLRHKWRLIRLEYRHCPPPATGYSTYTWSRSAQMPDFILPNCPL